MIVPALSLVLFTLAGVVLARLRLIDEAGGRGLSAYVYWIAFPALLLVAVPRAADQAAAVAPAVGLYALVLIVVGAAAFLCARAFAVGAERAAVAAMSAGVGNTAFLGLPLVTALTGEPVGAAFVAAEFTLVLAAAVALVARAQGKAPLPAAIGALANPITAAALLGTAAGLVGFEPLQPVGAVLVAAGATATPVALVALGALLARPPARAPGAPSDRVPLAIASVGKLVAAPLLVWAALAALGAPPAVLASGVVLAACPTAVTVFVQARALDAAPALAARAVAVTTLAAAPILAVLLGVFG